MRDQLVVVVSLTSWGWQGIDRCFFFRLLFWAQESKIFVAFIGLIISVFWNPRNFVPYLFILYFVLKSRDYEIRNLFQQVVLFILNFSWWINHPHWFVDCYFSHCLFVHVNVNRIQSKHHSRTSWPLGFRKLFLVCDLTAPSIWFWPMPYDLDMLSLRLLCVSIYLYLLMQVNHLPPSMQYVAQIFLYMWEEFVKGTYMNKVCYLPTFIEKNVCFLYAMHSQNSVLLISQNAKLLGMH